MNTKEAVLEFFENVKKDTVQDQLSKNIKASGKSAASLEIKADGNGGQLLGSAYFYQQIHGRRPGKMPPVSDLLAWVKVKGIGSSEQQQKGIAWAISKKIANEGTDIFKGKRAGLDWEIIINDNTKALMEALGENVMAEVTNNLIKEFDGINANK